MPKAKIRQNILSRLFIFTITFLPLISGFSKAPEKNPDIEDGSTWTEAIDPGFNNKNNYAVVAMAEYKTECGANTLLDTITTDSNGNYIFTSILKGTYTIIPVKTGYTFSPASQSVTVSGSDLINIDFTANISCDTVDRFLDNNDGTVTDCRTDLIWLKNANCYSGQDWDGAMASAAGLNSGECGLNDGSSEGDWQLATKEDLQGIGTDLPTTWIDGYPSVTWTEPGSPFVNVDSYRYWSSTEGETSGAWYMKMNDGLAWNLTKISLHYLWPVRSDD